ncbi:hypothetical protein L13192_06498 [Pyrenophora tritici-repentis]|uniref:Uncharacterized protein n=2 Tax=Pyrenophora tritici-repentis TaxID=45151 RepID=A0A922N9T9_9PLEO|nr:uncharacterized protein PTRG_09441 [Pyrenophora tritici-repentis Pt-1C-BFP]EDU42492.1 predicted protein [Pyrenophora tritici-repentis Pt-1C-BFP]KAI1512168.1 hypothetical protein Ptr86124_009008 [Pyrenophora tritici-repentis]KAI1669039.1 hypothetical protein L13192_06498 [Pyrenophora tritici-repentis]KAI1684246.1 hypothetical protein KJE20_06751 [Pyrenophora tritici-repentis]
MTSPPRERGRTMKSTRRSFSRTRKAKRRGTPLRIETDIAPVEKGESSKTASAAKPRPPVQTEDSPIPTSPASNNVSSWLEDLDDYNWSPEIDIPPYPTFTGKGKQRATDEEVAAQEYYSGGKGPVRAHGDNTPRQSDSSDTLMDDLDVDSGTNDFAETGDFAPGLAPGRATLSEGDIALVRQLERIDLQYFSEENRVRGPELELVEEEPEPEAEEEPEPEAAKNYRVKGLTLESVIEETEPESEQEAEPEPAKEVESELEVEPEQESMEEPESEPENGAVVVPRSIFQNYISLDKPLLPLRPSPPSPTTEDPPLSPKSTRSSKSRQSSIIGKLGTSIKSDGRPPLPTSPTSPTKDDSPLSPTSTRSSKRRRSSIIMGKIGTSIKSGARKVARRKSEDEESSGRKSDDGKE